MMFLKRFIKMIWGFFKLISFKFSKIPVLKNANLIFYFPYYHLGGAEQVHLDIVKAVQHKRCVVIFTHLSATPHFLKSFREVANVIELNDIINKKSTTVTRFLLKSIANAINKSESVHKILGCNSSYYYESLPLFKKEKLDLVHAVPPDPNTRKMLANSACHLDKRIVINKKGVADLNEINHHFNIPLEKQPPILVINNGIEIPTSPRIINKDSKQLHVGFVGRWSEEKRPELYLQIANKFKEDYTIEWTMAGSGLKHKSSQINAAGVKNLEQINNKRLLIKHYKELHVILITSIYEGFPMVVMEAMSYGVIPICTNVGGISEHIEHGVNGFLINDNGYRNDELLIQFVEVLQNLKTDPSALERISLACVEYAKLNFSMENFNRSYQRLLT